MHPLLSWLIPQCSWGTHATRTGISNVMPHILRFDNVTQDVLDAKNSIAFGALWKKHVETAFSTRKLPPVRKIYDVRHFFFEKKPIRTKPIFWDTNIQRKNVTFEPSSHYAETSWQGIWVNDFPNLSRSDMYPFPGGYPGMYKTL